MQVRAISLLLGGIFFGLSTVPAFAAAEGGLTIVAIVSPPDQSVNERVDVDVEVYRWGTPTDPESLQMRMYTGAEVPLTRTAAGRYHGTLTLAPEYFAYTSSLTFYVEARIGNSSAYTTVSYVPRSPPAGGPGGSVALLRILNLDQIGWYPASGETVNLEARTFVNGEVVDPSTVSGGVTVGFQDQNSSNFEITFIRQQAGVFTGSITVPADLAVSANYFVSVFFRSDTNRTFGSGYGATKFQVHPVPAVAWLEGVTETSAVVRVLAGDRSGPIAGASVSASARMYSYGGPPPPESSPPATGVTDANGSANLTVNYAVGQATMVRISTTLASRQTVVSLFLRSYDPGGYYNWTPPGLSAKVVTDTSSLRPGETAVFTVHLEVNGTPLYARRITRIVYPAERPGMTLAGNVTTGPTGNFTVTYPIPTDWSPDERLTVLVQTLEGEQMLTVVFGGGQMSFSRRLALTATYDATSRRIALAANYSGGEALTGASVIAMLFPGGDPFAYQYRVDGKPIFVALARSGSSFTGNLEVPSWMPLGNYTVLAGLGNGGATSSPWDAVDAWNATVVRVTEAPAQSPSKGVLPGGFVPGFEAAAVVGAVAGVTVAARRVRKMNPS